MFLSKLFKKSVIESFTQQNEDYIKSLLVRQIELSREDKDLKPALAVNAYSQSTTSVSYIAKSK